MAKLPPIGSFKESELQIPEGQITGGNLREAFRRFLSTLNPFSDALTKLASKGITLTENVRCDIVTGKFSHATGATVALHTLRRASSAVVLGANGYVAVGATVIMQQTTAPQATVTVYFLDSTATNVTCTLLLLEEGTPSTSAPAVTASSQGPAGGDLTGTYPNPTVTATHLVSPLPLAQGGTGTAGGDTAWQGIMYQNGWAAFGTTVTSYRKDALSFVHVKGRIMSGTMGSASFTLPAGYRPAEQKLFPARGPAGAIATVIVNPDGTVAPLEGSNADISLDSVYFLAEQ